MTTAPQRLRALHVRRPHGVHGELRVEPLGGGVERFQAGLRLWSDADPSVSYTVASARATGDGDVLLSLAGVDTRSAAEALHGAYLCVDRGDLRRLGEDEWFVFDLVGMRVVAPDGAEVGVVSDVEEYPEHEVLVVRPAAGGVERRIPMVRAHVTGVDVASGTITVVPWAEDEA